MSNNLCPILTKKFVVNSFYNLKKNVNYFDESVTKANK